MAFKQKDPPKKLWTAEDRRRHADQLREQRELRELYRRRFTKQGGRP